MGAREQCFKNYLEPKSQLFPLLVGLTVMAQDIFAESPFLQNIIFSWPSFPRLSCCVDSLGNSSCGMNCQAA